MKPPRSGNWNAFIQIFEEEWTSPRGDNSNKAYVTGSPQFITSEDQQAWEQAGSPPIESEHIGYPGAVYYDVANLPTDPSQMAAGFATEADVPGAADSSPAAQFTVAAEFLGHGASSLQRVALLRYMATLPGLQQLGWSNTIGTGQRGATIGINVSQGMRTEIVLDLANSEFLELRQIVVDPNTTFGGGQLHRGEAATFTDFSPALIASTQNVTPSGSESAPEEWASGSRAPVSNVALPSGVVEYDTNEATS